jgi:hypothetical protein
MHPKNKYERKQVGKRKGRKRISTTQLPDNWSIEEKEQWTEKSIGIHTDCTKLYSCPNCGNPRKYFNGTTIQEKRRIDSEDIGL